MRTDPAGPKQGWLVAARLRARFVRTLQPCARLTGRDTRGPMISVLAPLTSNPARPASGLVPLKSGEISGVPIPLMLDAMDRRIVVARALERAEQRVADGERLIAQQNELIANLSALGLDASAFRNTLARLEQAQVLRVRLASERRRELLNASPAESSVAARPTISSPSAEG
jgi:hypothetical protein